MAKNKGKNKNKKPKNAEKQEEPLPEETSEDAAGSLDDLFDGDDADDSGGALDDLFDEDDDDDGGALEELFDDTEDEAVAAKPLASSEGSIQVKEPVAGDDDEDEEDVDEEEVAARNLKEIFGVSEEGARLDDIEDYAPDSDIDVGIPTGKLAIVVFVTILLVALFFIARYAIDQREEEIAAMEASAEQDKMLEYEEPTRYGHLAILASTPAKALILKNDKPIYAQTSPGPYTELRAGHSTKVQNIKIEGQVRFVLQSEGYKDYELIIDELDWVPRQASDDFEKIINNVRLEPDDSNLYSAIPNETFRKVTQESPELLTFKRVDELQTRSSFERMYDHKLIGRITVNADKPGSKIFYLGKPVYKADGTLVELPGAGFSFNFYRAREDGSGYDVYDVKFTDDAGNPVNVRDPKDLEKQGVPADAKPVSITQELSIRLELDGHYGYITAIYPHQWHCTPVTNESRLQATKTPEKLEKTAIPLFHHFCDYSIDVMGKLHPEKKADPNAKPGDPAANGGAAPPAGNGGT